MARIAIREPIATMADSEEPASNLPLPIRQFVEGTSCGARVPRAGWVGGLEPAEKPGSRVVLDKMYVKTYIGSEGRQ